MLFPTVALLLSTPPLISTLRRKNPLCAESRKGRYRSLSFAMQRVCFQTKRTFHATNRAAELALNNFGTDVVGCR
jgi:hypothetical protein